MVSELVGGFAVASSVVVCHSTLLVSREMLMLTRPLPGLDDVDRHSINLRLMSFRCSSSCLGGL